MNRFYKLAFEDDKFMFTTDTFMFYDKLTKLLNDNKHIRLFFDKHKQKPYKESEVKDIIKDAESKGVEIICICIKDKDDIEFIGVAKLKRRGDDATQLSIALIPEYQNKGYGKSIINKLCIYANNTYDRIFVRCKSIDTRALDTFKKCKFLYHSLDVEDIWLVRK